MYIDCSPYVQESRGSPVSDRPYVQASGAENPPVSFIVFCKKSAKPVEYSYYC